MGAKAEAETARRMIAVVAFGVTLVGFGCICAALGNPSWSHYEQIDGRGSFGLWEYSFFLKNVSRSGDIQSHAPTALCNLGIYNASRNVDKAHDKVPGRWKDDCDDMIDACGLAQTLGVLAAMFALAASVLSALSGWFKDDDLKRSGTGVVSAGTWQWPSYSTTALVCVSVAATFTLLSALAYSGERPATPNKFLRDYDTPGANRYWALGRGFYTMIGSFFVMLAGVLLLVTVQNSRKIFLTGCYQEIGTSLLTESEVQWDHVDNRNGMGQQQMPL